MGEAKRRGKDGKGGSRRQRSGLIGALLVGVAVLLVAAVVVFWVGRDAPPAADELPRAAADSGPYPAELDRYGISIGNPRAPVTVREFADFQCPACARFAATAGQLKREYIDTGKVRLVFYDLPLPQHQAAIPAALAGRCAHAQRAFWPMYETLFARQDAWSSTGSPQELFVDYAGELGLDREAFARCLRTERFRPQVQRSAAVAQQLRVAQTPTVLVDNIHLPRPSWPVLQGVIERELAAE